MISADHATLYALLLFAIGLGGLVCRREAVMRLVSIEILLGAVAFHLIAASRLAAAAAPARGEALALVVLLIALVTAAVGTVFLVAPGPGADGTHDEASSREQGS